MSSTKSVGKVVMAPLIAAGTSVATRYVVKRGPEFVEGTVLPWLREATQPGGTAEKLQEKARSAVSSGGDLAGQLNERARDVTSRGGDGGSENGGDRSGRTLSRDQLSQRTEERAKHRAQRRKTTKKK